MVREGDLLWTPSPDQVARANITAFTAWLAAERQLRFASYEALWQWSVTDLDGFWQAVWDYCGIRASTPPSAVLGRRSMPGADWFPGARLNYAEHILRRAPDHRDALLFAGENVPLQALSRGALGRQVRTLATFLRARGVRPASARGHGERRNGQHTRQPTRPASRDKPHSQPLRLRPPLPRKPAAVAGRPSGHNSHGR